MNFKQKLLLRHRNPKGLALRVITYLAIGISLWFHQTTAVIALIGIDMLNWFFMQMVKPEQESEMVKKIVQAELDWIRSPWNALKISSVVFGIALFIVLGIGLWHHNWRMLVGSFVLIAILKQLMLKMANSSSSKG